MTLPNDNRPANASDDKVNKGRMGELPIVRRIHETQALISYALHHGLAHADGAAVADRACDDQHVACRHLAAVGVAYAHPIAANPVYASYS